VALSINQLRNGLTILVDGEVHQVIEFQHIKPGKGAAFVRTKLKNLKTGSLVERTFKGDERIEEAFVEEKKLQFLFKDSHFYNFLDGDSFEQIQLDKEKIGQLSLFLKENQGVSAFFYKGEILNISLPNFVELEVKQTEPGIRGDTAKSGTKPAVLETGLVVQVPLFINVGDKIKIDTRKGEYVERL
jgi:elongation factor P